MKDNKQISSRGIAQQSGLDVFSSITTFNGEYMNWGNSFDYGTQLGSDTDYATTAANPHTDALINSPASTIGRWYRYHTSGSPYTSVSAPTSSSGAFIFYGQKTGGLPSYSGIYQKLSLIRGNEYQIEIQGAINASAGTLYIKTYKPDGDSFTETSSTSITYPFSNTSIARITSTFTAETANDIIQLYFTTDSTSAVVVPLSTISIKEKQEYLVPVYATDKYGNDHKVLRRTTNQTVSDD
tara:strand:- start:163 stop:882 length:720 start_codon:yes stop_codon:yes gene_type:complete